MDKRIHLSIFSVFLLLISASSCGEGSTSSDLVQTDTQLRTKPAATLNDFWQGRAQFIPTATDIGSSFNMHFLSTVQSEGTFYSYYVKSPVYRKGESTASTHLAKSNDGIHFRNHGEVIGNGGNTLLELSAETDFRHELGNYDSKCGGWSAASEQGYLAFGALHNSIPPGAHTANYILRLHSEPSNRNAIATAEVFDQTAQLSLAKTNITTKDFTLIGIDSAISLEFIQSTEHELEFRLFYNGNAAICFRAMQLHTEHAPSRDDRIASFPSVTKDGNTWYMAYEGASTSLNIQGEIRLATSPDGIHWTKNPNPLLVPTLPWQRINVGTPSLLKRNGTWFLFYHGFDGERVQIGAATGSTLNQLVPVNNNEPIITNGLDWDAGTVGKRSILYEAPYFYMVYEGSTLDEGNSGFANSQWASGLARSADLQHWEKFSLNPIIGPTNGGFGFDGPEFIRFSDGSIHIYYRNTSGFTDRVTLVELIE